MAKISIIMGIYNCASTLPEAIDCILAQTVTDWELIMCDDGSKDNTFAVAKEYADRYPDKIKLLQNEQNLGLNATLNKCLSVAESEYIARMDGDDICTPDRFEKELAMLESDESLAVVSCDMEFFDETGKWGYISHPDVPTKKDFLHGSPFCHAPCIMRKSVLDKVGGYSVDKKLLRVEDYHLWMKIYAAGYVGKNIHLPLYSMRDDRNAYSRRRFKYRLNESYVKRQCVKKLGLPKIGYIHALRPILVGLLPSFVYNKLHKRNLKGEQ